jgi:hypothetical protein
MGPMELFRVLTRRASHGKWVDTDTGHDTPARPAGAERSVDRTDENAPELTDHDERAIEAIRRQLDTEFAQRLAAWETEHMAPREVEARDVQDSDHPRQKERAWSHARRLGTPVATLLLGCAALGAILHQKDADVAATADSKARRPGPESGRSDTTTQATDSSSPLSPATQMSSSPLSPVTQASPSLSPMVTETTRSTDMRTTSSAGTRYQPKPKLPAQRPGPFALQNRSSSGVAQASRNAKPDAERLGPPAPPQPFTSHTAVMPPPTPTMVPPAVMDGSWKATPDVERATAVLAP